MPYHGRHEDEIRRSAEELAQSGEHYLTGEELAADIRYMARVLGIDLDKPYDIKEARRILSKGTPISDILREMRDEIYEESGREKNLS